VDPNAQEVSHEANVRGAAFWPTDSILAAVALTRKFWVIAIAVAISILVMLCSMDAVSRFMERNPTVVMLALAFLLMIGMVLVADGFDVHVPKGFVYAAMPFAVGVKGLNLVARHAARRRQRGATAVSGAARDQRPSATDR
jgi:predicted tellurium resistance membrane protein TerC